MKKVKANGKTYTYETLHVTLSEPDKKRLKKASDDMGVSMSDIIRMSLKRFLKEFNN